MEHGSLTVFLLAFILSNFAQGHSWVEQVSLVSADGTFSGSPGFPRGNVPRTSPSFSDAAMTYLLPPDGRVPISVLPTDNICMPSQEEHVQTGGSPALQAPSGAQIALRYQENGHVTLPNTPPGKPAKGGHVSIYGTSESMAQDTLLEIHNIWNSDGSGGDGRGRLLAQSTFDDGKCFQVNNSPISQARQQLFGHPPDPTQGSDLWCHNVVSLPDGLAPGSLYTLYWVWDWPTAPGTSGFPIGKTEIYTTCVDVQIIA